MIQLDNVKMWEYLIKQSEEYLIFCQIATWLKEALHEQGLEFKDGHIISITEQNADFKIEKGKWYVCTKPFLGFYVGDLGYCDCDGDISHRPNATERYHVVNADCFRPATEEEIMAIVSIKPEPLSPAPQRNNYDEIKQAEPKQENSPILSNSSNTAKNDELTEFELCLFDWLSSDTGGVLTNDSMRQVARNRAKELMDIARREIAEGIENDRIVMLNNHFADVPQEDRIRFDSYFYEEGIRDIVKKLKED